MNDVNILFGAEDRVTPKVRKMRGELDGLKRSADSAGKSIAHTGQALGRVGGAAGGILGRATGGFGQGLGAGAVGVAAAGVGLGVTMLQASSERAMDAARSRTQWRHQAEALQEQAREQVRQRQAGGKSYIQTMRRMLNVGMSMDSIRSGLEQATSYGLTSEEGLAAMEAAKDYQAPRPVGMTPKDASVADKASRGDIMLAMSTGLWSDANSAAEAVRANNGVANAVDAAKGTPRPEGVTAAEADDTVYFTNKYHKDLRQINRANVAENRVSASQIEDLVSGRTATVLEQNAAEQMDPLAKLVGAAGREAMRVMETLQAAAKAQGAMVGVLTEMGRVVGMGNGSASRAVKDFANTVNGE